MSIAHFAVTRRVAVTMLATAIIVLGVFAIPRLAVALLPSFSPPVVSVTVNYTNVAPETIETTVTRPIENAVSRVSGIDILQSDSFQGSSVVTARFKFGTDINVAAVDVQQQVARILSQLPSDPNLQQPQIIKADPNSLPVVFLFVTDSNMTQRDLGDLINNSLSDEFSAVSGVASVGVVGALNRAIMVQPNQTALAANGITPDGLVARLKAENQDLPAGIAQIGRNEYQIRTNALYTNVQQIQNTIVAVKNGAPVRVGDVAKVSDSIQEQRIFTRLDGKPAVRLGITAQPDANIVTVANGVYAKIDELKKRYPGMQFGVVLDQRGFIQDSIDALEHTGIYGAVLAILIILLFLHSWRSTLIVAVSLPISILGTLFAAYLFHETLNTMTLGGLALAVGLIVDDAIVVIENIFRHMHDGQSPLEAAESATAQIFTAVMASSITVITVFIPLLLIPGLQGLIFGPFAIMVMVAVGLSLLVALTTVPMLSSIMLRPEHSGTNGKPKGGYARFTAAFDRGFERVENWYKARLGWALDHPGIILGFAGLVFIGTIAAVKLGAVATETFPQTNSRYARIDVTAPNGTGLDRTNQITLAMEKVLREDPQVEALGAAVGSAFGGGGLRTLGNRSSLAITLKAGMSSADIGAWVQRYNRIFDPSGRGRPGGRGAAGGGAAGGPAPQASPTPDPDPKREALRQQRIKDIRAARKLLIGSTIRARTIDIIQQQIAQGQDALQIQIFGPDITTLYNTAKGVLPQLAQIPGIVRPDTNVTDSQPELDVRIDRTKAANLGLTTGSIAQAVGTATNGTIASYYQLNGQQYPIYVQLPPDQRRTFEALQDLQITPTTVAPALGSSSVSVTSSASPAPSSVSLSSVPLLSIADVVFGTGPSQISRQNKQRRIDINSPVLNRPLGDVVADAQQVMDRYQLPPGYRWQFGPSITQNNDTFGSLGLVVLLAVALIYMLLATQFESFLHPLVIMMSVPLSLAGAVGALWFRNLFTPTAFGLTAFIGILMLVGIVVKNAILVVEFTNQLRHEGQPVRDALMHAAPMRLRPILMTTLATIGGMIPLAFGFEAGASTQAPLGTVVIGGLLVSTMLSLLVVPTLYLWVANTIEARFNPRPPLARRTPPPAPREPQPVQA